MSHLSFQDRWVIVTGASSGLGRAIARELAVHERARVIAVARRADRLHELCREIAQAGGAEARALPLDLLEAGAADELISGASEIAGELPFGLVNNAGVTWYGRFRSMPVEELHRIVTLNISVTMELTLRYVSALVSGDGTRRASGPRGRRRSPVGAILTITSLGAFVPVPYQSVYAASKHALQAFSESLSAELRPDGIVAAAVGPGGVETEMIGSSGLDGKFPPKALASPDRIARAAIRAWKRRRVRSVPGVGNLLTAFAGRVLPARVIARISERLFRP